MVNAEAPPFPSNKLTVPENPIVCALHHDDWELIPWASSWENFFKLIAANEIIDEAPFTNDFWANKEDLEYLLCDYGHQEDYKNIQPVKSLREAVTMDDKSPVCLKYLGDSYRKTRNIALAEECYKKALLVLPEYGEASFALAMLYRSELNNHLAIPHFIDAFTAPFYFIKDKAKILQLLSRYSDDNLYDKNDPVWKRRYMFKLDEGEKYPNFHRIINEVIEEYMEKGEFKRAIGLRLFLGTFARSDERLVHRYQLRDHQMLLCQNLETAGFNKRIPLLGL